MLIAQGGELGQKPHCNADASNPSLITTFMEMGPRTKFI